MSSAGVSQDTLLLTLTAKNLRPDAPNKNIFVLNLNQGPTFRDDWEVCVSGGKMFFSWGNVTSAYRNNICYYWWWSQDDADYIPYLIQFTDGLYLPADICNYIQGVMLANGHYLNLTVSGVTTKFYPFQLTPNPTYNGFELTIYTLSNDLQLASDGYELPDNSTWDRTITGTPGWANAANVQRWMPSWQIPANPGFNSISFGSLVGFSSFSSTVDGYWPGLANGVTTNPGDSPDNTVLAASDASYDAISGGFSVTPGTFTPTLSPVLALRVNCNLALNQLISNAPNTILMIEPEADPGDSFRFLDGIPEFQWIPMQKNNAFQSVEVSFADQDNMPLVITDPNLVISLYVRKRPSSQFPIAPVFMSSTDATNQYPINRAADWNQRLLDSSNQLLISPAPTTNNQPLLISPAPSASPSAPPSAPTPAPPSPTPAGPPPSTVGQFFGSGLRTSDRVPPGPNPRKHYRYPDDMEMEDPYHRIHPSRTQEMSFDMQERFANDPRTFKRPKHQPRYPVSERNERREAEQAAEYERRPVVREPKWY